MIQYDSCDLLSSLSRRWTRVPTIMLSVYSQKHLHCTLCFVIECNFEDFLELNNHQLKIWNFVLHQWFYFLFSETSLLESQEWASIAEWLIAHLTHKAALCCLQGNDWKWYCKPWGLCYRHQSVCDVLLVINIDCI